MNNLKMNYIYLWLFQLKRLFGDIKSHLAILPFILSLLESPHLIEWINQAKCLWVEVGRIEMRNTISQIDCIDRILCE